MCQPLLIGSSTFWLRFLLFPLAKAQTGLPVSVEVANFNHVFASLKHGMDILWIGARTTVNPFSVQEIADALKGTDATVLVKNPINPTNTIDPITIPAIIPAFALLFLVSLFLGCCRRDKTPIAIVEFNKKESLCRV